MVSHKVRITNPTGLHLRPAGILCDTANKFECNVTLEHNGSSANAKSVLSVLGACIKSGEEIVISCDGFDEVEALKALIFVVEDGLGE